MELFIIGITASFGPCLAFCSPVILPYIAATKQGWKEGLVAILIFSFARLITYALLGLMAGLLGNLLAEQLCRFNHLVFLGGGILVSFLGVLILFGKEPQHRLCQVLRRQVIDDSIKGPAMLGITVGILPCLPLLGVLTYIALQMQNLWQGAFYGLAFGIGKLISPLIPLGILASTVPIMVIKSHRVYSFFSRLCGFLLFLMGVNLVVVKLLIYR